MKLNDLKKAATRFQEKLRIAERKAADLQRKAKAAKAGSEQTRLEHKRARKAAKQSKKLASAAEDQAREQRRVLEKARKRLAKALKKLAQRKGKQKSKPARSSAVARPPAPNEAVRHCAKDPQARSRWPVSVSRPRKCHTATGHSYGLTCGAFDLAAKANDSQALEFLIHTCSWGGTAARERT